MISTANKIKNAEINNVDINLTLIFVFVAVRGKYMMYNILVVDTDEDDRSLMVDALSMYNIMTASDFNEAKLLLELHVDISLVILDATLNPEEAFNFLILLKSENRYSNIRSIIITNDNETESKCIALGAFDFIHKPFYQASLRNKVKMFHELSNFESYKDKLKDGNLVLQGIFEQAPIGIVITGGDVYQRFWPNPRYEEIVGRNKSRIIRDGWANIIHPDDYEKSIEANKLLMSGEIKSFAMDKRYIKPDGSVVWAHILGTSVTLSGSKRKYIYLIDDITKRKTIEEAFQESERAKSVLLYHLPGMAYRCKCDKDWTMLFVSAGCRKLTGYSQEDLLYNKRLSFNDIIAPEYRKILFDEWNRVLASREIFQFEYEIITPDGARKWVLETGEGVYDSEGKVDALEGIILDITEKKEYENHLRYSYLHDSLTGLYNRHCLISRVREDQEKDITEKRALIGINLTAIYFLSLVYGFQYSQDLIKKIAHILLTYASDNCQLFHTYENRFVFYLKNYSDENDITAFCVKIGNTLNSLLSIERVNGGIGIVEIQKCRDLDIDQVLKNLLIASEKAFSNATRDFDYCFFNDEMEKEIMQEEEIKRELIKVISNENIDQLYLQFQPIIDLKTDCVCCFEALARLKSDTLDTISPLKFIPIAERTKFIIDLGEVIMRKALLFLKGLSERGHGSVSVAVNISALEILSLDFNNKLFKLIKELEVNPRNIIIEITESVFMSDFHQINSILGELQASGVKIAIDDFGTGYSSLARERELNINYLKLDKSFTDKLEVLGEEIDITSDIISMAHKLGHIVVAEGVETEKQRNILKKYGCDKIQGFLISQCLYEEEAYRRIEEINKKDGKACEKSRA